MPALVGVHLAAIVLTPTFAASRDGSALLLEVLVELLLCLSAVVLLFLLLVTNPGFVEVPTALSCRCRRCGVEVDDFDHHCGAVGACIGKGNMCYFILFLLSSALLCAFGAAQNAAFVAAAVRARSHDLESSQTSREALTDIALAALRSPRALCLLVLSALSVIGGAVTTFLCLRYTYLAHRGRSSLRRRRQFSTSSSLFEVFSQTLHPTFSHNFKFSRHYALEQVSD
ncbi:hypothetical protein LSCM1_02459 [Leishmania martiniquensis]|uniref:Palmitoyltransferase n=1 Tax=Leishmania martiniquensis TaxID=1580590 RepID=A0A836G8G8_9TRYP|nr:hypothetical protein LSCM1_02459 [Leishmania martiniquensis]